MSHSADVVVIGGGVAGCAVAYYLARGGAQVTIVEREGVASQASGYNAGGLNPLQGAGIPGPLAPLASASFAMHLGMYEQLVEQSGIDYELRRVESLTVAFAPADFDAMRVTHELYNAAAADGFEARMLDGAELEGMEPGLGEGALGGLFTYGNAALSGYDFTRALCVAAERAGARLRRGEVSGLRADAGRVTAVEVDGDPLPCGQVVLAAGPWSGHFEQWLQTPIPVRPLKGEILRVRPAAPLARQLSGAGVTLYRRQGGLVWIGATESDQGYDRQPTAAARETLLAGAQRLLPAMAAAELVQHTACLRPVSPDWLPLVGRAPGWDNVYLATGAGKKGVLIGPGIGRGLAEIVADGATSLPVAAFAPERFREPIPSE